MNATSPGVRIESVELSERDVRLRTPFRFGAVTLTELRQVFARVTIAADGVRATGWSGDFEAPKWFEKDPAKSAADDVANLAASARTARDCWLRSGRAARSAFEHWWEVYAERVDARPPDAADRLVRNFGVSLIERAVLDAVCRAAEVSFFEAWRGDVFGFRPEVANLRLAGWAPRLGDRMPSTIEVRHTIGLADPLRVAGVREPLADGLPEALEEDVRRYGLRWFKIKIGAGVEADAARLLALADVLDDVVDGTPRITLDGNEQYDDVADVARLLETVAAVPAGARLLAGLSYVEQPLHREATFDPDRTRAMPRVVRFAPVIIDEADLGIDAFERAFALGYRGVSAKSCKGVFRAMLNCGMCELLGDGAFQTAEDLTTLPVLALQQDLALMATLGLAHAERNGHHYFRGLDHLPRVEAESAARAHADLYCATPDGFALDIQDGRLRIGSLDCVGFGVVSDTA